MKQSGTIRWYIGKVVNVADPEKRRRIQVRYADYDEEACPDEKLPWLYAWQQSKDTFFLPEQDSSVLVLELSDYIRFWLELPDMSSWSEFSDDDYARAYKEMHKDVLDLQYTDTDGWKKTVVGKGLLTTDLYTIERTEDTLTFTFADVKVTTNGSKANLTVKDIVIDTDGSKVSIAGSSSDLKTCLDALLKAIYALTVPTAMGPSGPPINIADFQKVQQDLGTFLK